MELLKEPRITFLADDRIFGRMPEGILKGISKTISNLEGFSEECRYGGVAVEIPKVPRKEFLEGSRIKYLTAFPMRLPEEAWMNECRKEFQTKGTQGGILNEMQWSNL